MIDLRSDTVTVPSDAMRAAMAAAPVGDDQYGEDPSVNALQERVAALLGKEAALFVVSGTMANQIALKLSTQPGDEVILGAGSHVAWHEAGASPVNAGVQFATVGAGGLFDADAVSAAFKPRNHVVMAPTTLVVVENTHNRGGGFVFPQANADAICARAAELGMRTYLDGARLFNASVASGVDVGALAAPFDLCAVSLSKGLGCPIGSVLAGKRDDIQRAIRIRRMLGGAWRQAGMLAAAGLYALAHNVARLAEDHANARRIAEALAAHPHVQLDLAKVQTNIVVFELAPPAPDAATFVAAAAARGVQVLAFGLRTVRATTHMNVSRTACEAAAVALRAVLDRA